MPWHQRFSRVQLCPLYQRIPLPVLGILLSGRLFVLLPIGPSSTLRTTQKGCMRYLLSLTSIELQPQAALSKRYAQRFLAWQDALEGEGDRTEGLVKSSPVQVGTRAYKSSLPVEH